jgi:hypothetical protein
MKNTRQRKQCSKFCHIIAYLGAASIFVLWWVSSGSAQTSPAYLRLVQVIEPEKTDLSNPVGLAYSSKIDAFYILEAGVQDESGPVSMDLAKLNSFVSRVGSVRIAVGPQDPINIAYDPKFGRLLFIGFPANQLVEVRENSLGNLVPTQVTRFDISRFGYYDPQGLAIDPASGNLFILDMVGPRIIRIEPDSDGDINQAAFSEVPLNIPGLSNPRGIAFDPTSGHFHVISQGEKKLYELNQLGQTVAIRDLSSFNINYPQGIVFAPSGDKTDNSSIMSLYLSDSGLATAPSQEILLEEQKIEPQSGKTSTTSQNIGQVLELSLIEPVSKTESTIQSSLIKTVDLAAISPPSPDPSGLTYLSTTNTLLMSDGEVEEIVNGITHFAGANVWELTLSGSIVRTANISNIAPTVVPMSNEPTGVAWNSTNGHYYFSDDNVLRIFDLNPGPDGIVGTFDDSWTSFSTQTVGSGDPEGITYDSWHNTLFVVDGVNKEIYRFTTEGNLIDQFDIEQYGVMDAESIEFNAYSGTLYVLNGRNQIIEISTDGALIDTYDISAAHAIAPAGLVYAPASDGSGEMRFYIVDRGIDNNYDPNIVDGKMYEMSAPPPAPLPTITSSSTFTSTVTGTLSPTPLTATPSFTPTFTPTPNATVTANPNGFPTTNILDTFILPNGPIGSNWSGSITGYSIADNQLIAGSGGPIFWNPGSFSANQEAYVTIVNTDPSATLISLLLKSQRNTSTGGGVVEVWYNPSKNRIRVATYALGQSWVIRGADIPATFNNGDQLGAFASEDGMVYVYRNGDLLGIRDVTGWPYYANGGYIGLWESSPCNAILDNFGGGTSIPTATATPTSTATATRTFTPSATSTPTNTRTFTPSATSTLTASNTSSPISTATSTSTTTLTPTLTPTTTFTLTPLSTPSATITPTFTPSSIILPLIFSDGFEMGDLSAWASSDTDEGDLSVTASAAMIGNYGMQVLIDDNNVVFVEDQSPTYETKYRARFYFDPNSISMGNNNAHYIFFAMNSAQANVLQVELRYFARQYQLRVNLLDDTMSYSRTSWVPISDTSHYIEVYWYAANNPGSNDGGLTLWIDGNQSGTLVSVDNDTQRIETVRLGALFGVDKGTRGTYYFDDFVSHRQTYIGP